MASKFGLLWYGLCLIHAVSRACWRSLPSCSALVLGLVVLRLDINVVPPLANAKEQVVEFVQGESLFGNHADLVGGTHPAVDSRKGPFVSVVLFVAAVPFAVKRLGLDQDTGFNRFLPNRRFLLS